MSESFVGSSSSSSSETDNSFEEEDRGSKRKRSSSPCQSPTSSSSSNDELKSLPKYLKEASKRDRETSLSPLPNITSEWNQTHLDIINIHQKFLVKLEPSDFISMSYLRGIIMPTNKALQYVNWKSKDLFVQEITRCMSKALDAVRLNFDSVEEIPVEVPDEMKDSLKVWRKEFLKMLQMQKLEMDLDLLDAIEHYCWQVEQYGRKFADQLKYILLNKRDKVETSEGKFQQLFQYFLMMFDFNVSGVPNIDSQTVEIGDTKISSTADFLVMEANKSLEVLVVGEVQGMYTLSTHEVKRRYGKLDYQSSPVRTRSSKTRDSFVRHVSEDLIGQHGGELLSHIHLSLFGEKGIFGIIVQATQVSFTSLFPESGYLENIKKARGGNKEATLNISKGCNILTKAGREGLLKPLLDLYFLQAYTTNRMNVGSNQTLA